MVVRLIQQQHIRSVEQQARQTHQLGGIRIYDFDPEYRLRQITLAKRAEYAGKGTGA